MIRFSLPRSVVAGMLLAAAGLAGFGCAKKLTNVDPSYVNPEGQLSPDARLVIFPDLPSILQVYADVPPIGHVLGDGDSVIGVEEMRVSPAGTIHGIIFDGTDADAYQVLRREKGGGYALLRDFVLQPAVKWLDQHWEAYSFDDTRPSSYAPATYQGRGVVQGSVTATSPLTNAGMLGAPAVASIRYTGFVTPVDSLFKMAWRTVPGAAGYWLQVYQFRGDLRSVDEKILAGVPAPIALLKTRDIFVGYVTAPDTTYTLGSPVGAQVLTQKTPQFGQEYLVRVAAVDASGRLMAYTYGDTAYKQGLNEYRAYLLGAKKVTPTHPEALPARAIPDPAQATSGGSGTRHGRRMR